MREVVHYQFGAAFVRPTEAELHKVLPRWLEVLARLHPELLGLLGENPEDPENRAAILDRLIPQPEIVEQQIASSIATFAGITIDNDSTTSLKVLGMVLNSAAELPAFLFETGRIPKAILEVRNTGAAMVYSWLIELNEIIPQIRWSELVTAASYGWVDSNY
jgi:hypothetical protein